jgi:hypothetical protein
LALTKALSNEVWVLVNSFWYGLGISRATGLVRELVKSSEGLGASSVLKVTGTFVEVLDCSIFVTAQAEVGEVLDYLRKEQ